MGIFSPKKKETLIKATSRLKNSKPDWRAGMEQSKPFHLFLLSSSRSCSSSDPPHLSRFILISYPNLLLRHLCWNAWSFFFFSPPPPPLSLSLSLSLSLLLSSVRHSDHTEYKNVHIPKAEVELKVPNIFLQFKIVLHSSFQIWLHQPALTLPYTSCPLG